jgi:hypothetical protein
MASSLFGSRFRRSGRLMTAIDDSGSFRFVADRALRERICDCDADYFRVDTWHGKGTWLIALKGDQR